MVLTVELERQSVRIDATVTGTNNRLEISRISPSGTESLVRGWAPATVVAGTVIARDFEVPLGVPVTYTVDQWAEPGGAHTVETAAVTVPVTGTCDTWLTDIVRAANSQKIVIEALDELEYDTVVAVHQILDRRSPIVVSDITHTPRFELDFLTDTEDARIAARGTLGNGSPVLIRTTPDWGIGNLYLAVLGVTEQRLVKPPTQQARRWVVDAVQIERPDPTVFAPLGPVNYQHVDDTYATYAALKAGKANYDAVLYDWSGGAPSDIVGWPPTDA